MSQISHILKCFDRKEKLTLHESKTAAQHYLKAIMSLESQNSLPVKNKPINIQIYKEENQCMLIERPHDSGSKSENFNYPKSRWLPILEHIFVLLKLIARKVTFVSIFEDSTKKPKHF